MAIINVTMSDEQPRHTVKITTPGRDPEYVEAVEVRDSATGRWFLQIPVDKMMNAGDTITFEWEYLITLG